MPDDGRSDPGTAEPVLDDHWLRRFAGKLVPRLCRYFGAEHLELAEDVAQDALVAALRVWPYRGVPADPEAWFLSVARNRARDTLRREAALRARLPELAANTQVAAELLPDDRPFASDELCMMFLCAHPCVPEESRLALTLKTVCGLGLPEVGKALLISDSAAAQRLFRARRSIREQVLHFEMPADSDLPERRSSVLRVLYLLFNEGYTATRGENWVNPDLCDEAIRLGEILVAHSAGSAPETHALLALMQLQASRFPARTGADGLPELLEAQDRSRWDHSRIAIGLTHLRHAMAGGQLTRYHLEAGIAACHAAAPTFAETDWHAIRFYYDQLVELDPSPVLVINRAAALAMTNGPGDALNALSKIEHARELHVYAPLPATRADLLERLGRHSEASAEYTRAIALTTNEAERRLLEVKRERCFGAR